MAIKQLYLGDSRNTKIEPIISNESIPAGSITLDKLEQTIIDKINKIDNLEKLLQEKQDKLVSGTNIKTINNETLLGSGNITISGETAPQPPKDELLGTWLFNEVISTSTNFESTITFTYGDKRKPASNNIGIRGGADGGGRFTGLYYGIDRVDGPLFVYGSVMFPNSRWSNQENRTIEITDVSQLTNREEFRLYMKSNAVKQ